MSRTAWSLFLLFCPAGLGIVTQIVGDHSLDHRLIALGLLLLCIDQARMAHVDLNDITLARRRSQDPRLRLFKQILLSTIALELIGFYLAGIWLGWGIILVLLSQVWFNALAPIQIDPGTDGMVQTRSLPDRFPVILADLLGLGFICLWMANIAPLSITLILCGLAIAYACVKYLRSQLTA